jgi:hypothetical protein
MPAREGVRDVGVDAIPERSVRMRHCGCGAVFMPRNDALVCSIECLASEFGGEMPPKRWARIEPPWLPAEGTIPIPTKHMAIGMHWQKVNRDRDNFDFEEFIEQHAVPPIAVAVSKAQVYWARAELKKVEAGGYSPRSYEELKALAATPLEGLPERATKKPRKRTKAN